MIGAAMSHCRMPDKLGKGAMVAVVYDMITG